MILLLAIACGTSPAAAPATPQSVALQARDLPHGLVVCGLSGDVDQFFQQTPAGNQFAAEMQQSWATLKQSEGAQKGYVRAFAPTQDECKTPFTSQSLTPSQVWAASMVIQFKTASTAAKAYQATAQGNAEIALAPGAQQGAATGLGANSLTFGTSGGGLTVYLAAWQNARFMVVMLSLNVPEQTARQAARSINSRIH